MDELPKPRKIELFNQAFAHGVPHNRALGLRLLDFDRTTATMELPWREDLVGNPETGVLHGGAVTSLMDAACGAAVFVALRNPCRIATLDLRIDYLRPATPRVALQARAECYKVGRTIAFVRGLAFHDPDDPVAAAAGTFMLFRGNGSTIAKNTGRA